MIGNLTFHLLTQLTGPQELAVAPTSMLSLVLVRWGRNQTCQRWILFSGIQRLTQAIRVSSPI